MFLGDIMLMTILSDFLWFCLILAVVRKLIVFIYSEEDLYSDEAIQKAKEKHYPPLSSLSFEQIMEYKAKERIAILGLNSFKELYEQYPDYLRPVEKRHLANIGKFILREEDSLGHDTEQTENVIDDDIIDDEEMTATEKFLEMTLEERMEILDVGDYTEMCRDYPEYVTYEEFEELLKQGEIHSVDDVIYFKGRYYENEFSEEWEEFEYEWDRKHR